MGRYLLRERKVERVHGALVGAESLNEFGNYADAYRGAAKQLAGDRSNGGKWDLPIVSLYRHAIELMIKAILTELGPELGIDRKEVLNRSHDLKSQITDLERVARHWGVELTRDFYELIEVWQHEDGKGMLARYPETKDGKAKTLMYADGFDLASLVDDRELVLDELTDLLDEPGSQFVSDLTNKIVRPMELPDK
jgi:hypothetical protein